MARKKTVGISTWVGDISLNYGSLLQTTAMQQLVRNCGCRAITIKNHFDNQSKRRGKDLYFILNKFRRMGKRYVFTWLKFACWLGRYVHLSKECYNDYDVVATVKRRCQILLCGSDAIWKEKWIRPLFLWDYEELEKLPKIAYAPSIQAGDICYEMQRALAGFVAISGRESKVQDLLRPFTSREVVTVLDPTLTVDKNFWEKKTAKRLIHEDYVLCYFLSEPEMHHISVKKVAKKIGIPQIVYINTDSTDRVSICYSDYQGMDYKKVVGPKEFLSLVKYSKAVCTDSFHGICFSIVFEKDFYVFSRESLWDITEDYRFMDLFARLSTGDRRIIHNQDIDRMKSIDWKIVSKKRSKERENSKNFLRTALKKCL